MEPDIIKFVRQKDYVLVKELGQGAFGKTVLLRDDIIGEQFVCKKYSPIYEEEKELHFKNFIQEIKLLHLVYHTNIVRVFNYYIYPEYHTGYILMEFIDGWNIEDYLTIHPENINEVFLQTIEAFRHLESNNILHRDIRSQNIMVNEDGIVKIIDFGFGKKILQDKDFDKSISLNWWCTPPNEFKDYIYDYGTEVYFIGKLFEKLIMEREIEQFKYNSLLKKMCQMDPTDRINTFFVINKDIQNDRFDEIEFDENERIRYRIFSNNLFDAISSIMDKSKYYDDIDRIQLHLEDLYKRVMLEEYIPDNVTVIRCFINGSYRYVPRNKIPVNNLKGFISLLRSCSKGKKNIILSNIQTKLDSIKREYTDSDDDVPF